MQGPNILEIIKINKEFPGVKALDKVSMEIRKGEVHALLGENGAGKSTLIKIIAGVYTKDSGNLIFQGEECDFSVPADAFRRGISVIHQETSLIPELSVIQNVFLGIESTSKLFRTLDAKAMRSRYAEICSNIDFHIDPDRLIRNLSVAEKKIVEIVKALLRDAALIIMDEPTDSLTGKEIDSLYRIIKDLKKHEVTIIYITHYMEEVFAITDRASIMKDGKHILTANTPDLTSKTIISSMIGREFFFDGSEEGDFPARIQSGKTAMEARTISSGSKFQEISFQARYGEIVGFTGVIGSGKTELARALFGADPISSGNLIIKDVSIKKNSPVKSLKKGVGMLPEDRKTEGLILEQEIYKNLTMSYLNKKKSRFLVNKTQEYRISKDIIKRLKIKVSELDYMVKYLSGGNQQKIVIGKWLLADPDIIIMDEPTRGIDVGSRSEIYKIIKQLAGEGKCILFFSSEVPEIIAVSDRIMLMKKGRIVGHYDKGISHDELFHAMLEERN